MSTLAVSSSAYNGLNSLTNQSSQNVEKRSDSNQSSPLGVGMKSQIRAQIDEILKDVPKGDDGKLSFQDIEVHREKLEKEWDDSVKADLKKLGVNVDVEFPLSWDAATGKLTVNNSHPDKATIDNYFASNADKVEEFQNIIQLGKMTRSHTQKLEPSQLRQNIQAESMSWWYEDNSDPTSWFKGGGKMMGSTQATFLGLNLKV